MRRRCRRPPPPPCCATGIFRTRIPTAPQTFAINLSSARMRAAVALMQGVRSGQSIAALLGYQFERGLHEGHPGVELDQYISVLRDRFPLVSGRLTDLSPGVSIDAIEARNVVDGLALVERPVALIPYGISGLPATGTAEAAAIAAEIARAHERSTRFPICCWRRACTRRRRAISIAPSPRCRRLPHRERRPSRRSSAPRAAAAC